MEPTGGRDEKYDAHTMIHHDQKLNFNRFYLSKGKLTESLNSLLLFVTQ